MNRILENNAQTALSEIGKIAGHDLRVGKAIDTLRQLVNSHAEMRDLIESIEGKIQYAKNKQTK